VTERELSPEMTGIVVSTMIEAGVLIRHIEKVELFQVQGKDFHCGILKGTPVTICLCGVGKANAAHGTTLLVEKFRPEILYNVGVAGAYPASGLVIGDVVLGEKEIYGDEGLMLGKGFLTMDALGFPLVRAAGKDYYNEFPLFIPEGLRGYRAKGAFITLSSCTGSPARGRELESRFNALCENMEGAAVAHVCALAGIPVVEIRGISNLIEDRTPAPLAKGDIIKAAENVQKFFLERFV
jgi:futalosine hydrolase